MTKQQTLKDRIKANPRYKHRILRASTGINKQNAAIKKWLARRKLLQGVKDDA